MKLLSKIRQTPAKLVRLVRGVLNKSPSHPVLVYQMGKVGSKTIVSSLRAHAPFSAIHGSHVLNNLDEIEQAILGSLSNPNSSHKEVIRGRKLRELFLNRTEPWDVITLVRDPIARNISEFFHNLTELFPPEESIDGILGKSVEELREVFINRYSAENVWFQTQLEPLTGIDVYSIPFDHEEKCIVAEGDRCRLLVLRMEDLSKTGAACTARFLGLENLKFINANEASNKIYREMYKNFVRNARLSDEYLDRMYGSELVRHFYRPEEIAGFRDRWRQGAELRH